jgi:hypothetical protein
VFTVILLSDCAKTIFDKSKVFFEPFVEDGTIAFCEWNTSPNARTLTDALPDLPKIIRGKARWRAVVVDHAVVGDEAAPIRDPENPFDFVDNSRSDLNLEDSPHALIRLAHVLLGYPDMTAKRFEPVVAFTDPATRREKRLTASELAQRYPDLPFERAIGQLGQRHNNLRVQYEEVPYSEAEQARHRELSRQYRMKEVRPSEVVFIATRAAVEDDSRALLRRAWRTDSEQASSRFVERNDYPPLSRFAVYELLNPENSGYEQDELRLWLSVLSISLNLLPPSSFQADRVYRLGVELNEEVLGDALNTHLSRLSAIKEHIQSLIDRPETPPSTTVADLVPRQKLHVDFDRLESDDLAVTTTGYHLASDIPRKEDEHWREDFHRLERSAGQFARRPRRVLARAVYDARATFRALPPIDHTLSEIERSELEDDQLERVRRLTRPSTVGILDQDRLKSLLAEHDKQITAYIAQRMRRRAIVLATVLVLLVWVGVFVPHLLQAGGKGSAPLLNSTLVLAVILVVLATTGLLTLVWIRSRLIRMLRRLNTAMRGFANRVTAGADTFAGYLSELATYMHLQTALVGAARARDHRSVARRRLIALRTRVENAIRREKGILTSLGVPLQIQRTTTGLATFDPDNAHAVEALFRFPTGDRKAAVNESGETINTPYGFVTRLNIERLTLFESDAAVIETDARS